MKASSLKWILFLALAACLTGNVVLWKRASTLRREKEALSAMAPELEQLRQEKALAQSSQTDDQEIEQLRKDKLELIRLRNEVRQLRDQAPELDKLRAQTAELTRQLADARQSMAAQQQAVQSQIVTGVQTQLAQLERAQSIQCINNLKQLGLAARIWANDHNHFLPPDFLSMKNEISSPKILFCPADAGKTPVEDWQQLNPAFISYQYLLPNASEEGDPGRIMFRCPVHGNVGLVDGSAQMAPKQ
jgi:hypothetical protein